MGEGFLTPVHSLDECRQLVGGEPVVSKFGLVVKEKAGKIKRRLILDSKESTVTWCARKNHCIILPRVTDLVYDILNVSGGGSRDTEVLVLDITDAFWTLGL